MRHLYSFVMADSLHDPTNALQGLDWGLDQEYWGGGNRGCLIRGKISWDSDIRIRLYLLEDLLRRHVDVLSYNHAPVRASCGIENRGEDGKMLKLGGMEDHRIDGGCLEG